MATTQINFEKELFGLPRDCPHVKKLFSYKKDLQAEIDYYTLYEQPTAEVEERCDELYSRISDLEMIIFKQPERAEAYVNDLEAYHGE